MTSARGTEQHPAARAWAALGGHRLCPQRIEKLTTLSGRPTWKSDCYRLVGAWTDGGSVIAKKAKRPGILVERTVYRDVLSKLPMRTLHFYGFVENDDDDCCWLFLEDAGGEEYDDTLAAHRALAADWLGAVHTATCGPDLSDRLPDRGPAYYLDKLHAARRNVVKGSRDPRLSGAAVLKALARHCDALEASWSEVEAYCRALPSSLVHGDFTAKNVRVRREATGHVLYVMDWDVAGWGVPASDIAALDPHAYRSRIARKWRPLDLEALSTLACIGRVFRYLLWIEATSTALATVWTERPLRKLRIYEQGLARAVPPLLRTLR
jgi:hypothetical protein